MAKMDKGVLTGKPVTYPIPCPAGGVQMETFIPWTLGKRGIRREIITPLDAPQAFTLEAAAERTKRKAAQATPLIRALGLAHYWQRLIDEGKARTIGDIAQAEGIDVTQARRLLRLTLLAPAVVEPLLANLDVAINLESVLRRVMPLDWQEQGTVFAGAVVSVNACVIRPLRLARPLSRAVSDPGGCLNYEFATNSASCISAPVCP